jgi:hypothetical protein
MTNTTSNQALADRIERLVQEHIAASRKSAEEAVERAFASAAGARRVGAARQVANRSGGGKRRAAAEVAEVGERLYRAVCAKPGAGMTVLAAALGATARELHRPMTLLKRAGRVRSAGVRHLTRYFPTTNDATAAA